MSGLLKLRHYQEEAIDAVVSDWEAGVLRPALVMATGSGKTAVAAHIIARHAHGRAVFLVHRDELASQAHAAFRSVGLDVGIVKAGRNDVDAPVIVGSVQTLQNPERLKQVVGASCVIVDEAHRAAAPSYRRVLEGLGTFTDVRALGLSATLTRHGGGDLGAVWEKVAYTYDILDGISDGYLCDVVGRMVTVDDLSLSEVKTVGKDFSRTSLSEILMGSDARRVVVAAYKEHAAGMSGVCFTPDVKSAHAFAEAFTAGGIPAAPIWGAMPAEERSRSLSAARDGSVQVLVNCSVLTEGFDLPRMQCAVIARPTRNPGTFCQMVGRVTRKHPGKKSALVLDVVGASLDHRLATTADLSSKRITSVRTGESLREAAAREAKTRNPSLKKYVVDTREVDLFHSSTAVWLETPGGVWFIPTGNALVFLWPGKDGRYDVGIRPDQGRGGHFIQRDVDLDAAMSWGEEHAEEYAAAWQAREGRSFGTTRKASWRRSRPSESHVAYAESLGISLPEGARAGEVSDRIAVYRASKALDGRNRN